MIVRRTRRAKTLAAVLYGLALTATCDVRGQEIAVRPLGDERYELTLTSPLVLEVEAAQLRLLPRAVEICAGSSPRLGRYRFASREPVAREDVDEATSSFTLIQELQCSASGPSVGASRSLPTLGSEAEAEEVRDKVLSMTVEYFEDIANERYEEAYDAVDDTLRAYSTPESWAERTRSFRSEVGAAVSLKIRRLTIYDNPPGAPEPGLYIAADFDNAWENAPLHCGYVIWFRRDADTFRITREENGHVTAEQLKAMPTDDIRALRRQFRCVDE
jgi:hypothetical protein